MSRQRMPVSRTPALVALLLLASMVLAPSGSTGCAEKPRGKVIVLGLDSATWKQIDPLIDAGLLPNIAGLASRGCRGSLETLYPTISPLIWTSMITGVPAELHGRDFTITRIPGSYRFSQETGRLLAYPALWQVADHFGLRSVTVNWYSAESPWQPLRSRVLADRIEENRPVPVRFPEFPLPGFSFEVPGDEELFTLLGLERQGPVENLRPWLRHELDVLRWRYAEDNYFNRTALHLLFDDQQGQPDLSLVFLKGLDGVQHKFWQFMDAENFPGVDAGERRLFGGVIEAYYRYYDRVVGQYVARAEPGTTFILVSDHGMEPIQAQSGRSLPQDQTVFRNMSLFRPVGILQLLERLDLVVRRPDDSIDWSRTTVFPNGDKALTWEVGFCLNVEGREPQGTVKPEDYDRVLNETTALLGSIRSSEDGAPLFIEIRTRPRNRVTEILARVNPGLSTDTAFTVHGRTFTLGSLLEAYDMSGAHLFAPDGILLVSGPAIQPGSKAGRTDIYDVAPTICQLLGLPLPDDFTGSVLDIWDDDTELPEVESIPSYRGVVPGFDADGNRPGDQSLEPLSPAAEERLKSLGYIQ
jgi:predicted AlkP superfamily phosphohydrolase/phosphomutase